MRVLGIMSGTSLDGVDFAICEITRTKFELVASARSAFPKNLAHDLRLAATGHASSHATGQLHHDLGRFYANAAEKHFATGDFALIGLHGQTVYHRSHPKLAATLQIGEPAYLAAAFQVPVVSNFRANDIVAGGEGAPLAPVLHQRLFARRGKRIGVLNLGGIANITILDWSKPELRVTAWDTGPANMLLDLFMRSFTVAREAFDRNGSFGRKGTVDQKLLDELLRHPYFRRLPPKSTGREEFGDAFFAGVVKRFRGKPQDLLRTLYQLTVESVRKNVESAIDDLLVCGGGSKNGFFMSLLAEELPQISVRSTSEAGWAPQSIESCAFAYLAWLRINDLPGNIPAVTGARQKVLLGTVTSINK